jgi:glycosyltransferase involved in cell wall biosynthesis
VIVLQVNFDFAPALEDPEERREQYSTLTGWSEALLEAGADRVVVLQRFHRRATVTRHGVEYRFGRVREAMPNDVAAIEIAHVNGFGFPVRTRLLRAALPARTPLVVQDHGSGPPRTAAARAVRRRGFLPVDAFLFTAAELADPWRAADIIRHGQKVYEVPEASTALRPMARAAAREASGINGSPALLWVGRLNANKDPVTVLAGFERMLAAVPDASLTMIFGSDELLPDVRARLSASRALGQCVRLVGRVPHARLPAFYSAADIFVLGSHHESCGYALIEACACGAVPVVTSIPAFRAITGDGAPARLWPVGDHIALGHALIEMAGRDLGELRAEVALHFARELSWTAVGRRALHIYAEVRNRKLRNAGTEELRN